MGLMISELAEGGKRRKGRLRYGSDYSFELLELSQCPLFNPILKEKTTVQPCRLSVKCVTGDVARDFLDHLSVNKRKETRSEELCKGR